MPWYFIAIIFMRTLIMYPLIDIYERYATKTGTLAPMCLVIAFWVIQEAFERGFGLWYTYRARVITVEFYHKRTHSTVKEANINLFQWGFKNSVWLLENQAKLATLYSNIAIALLAMSYASPYLAAGWLVGALAIWAISTKSSKVITKRFDRQQDLTLEQNRLCQRADTTLVEKNAHRWEIYKTEILQQIFNFVVSQATNLMQVGVAIVVFYTSPASLIYVFFLVDKANRAIPVLAQRKIDRVFSMKSVEKTCKMLEDAHKEGTYTEDYSI